MRVVCWLWLGSVLVLQGFAANGQAGSQSITLEECFNRALQKNLRVQIERLNVLIAGYDLRGAYGAYEPTLGFRAGHQYEDVPGGVDFKKPNQDYPYQLSTDTFGPELSGKLPTGLSYDVRAQSAYSSADTDFGRSSAATYPPFGIRSTNQYFANLGLTLRQPLLKDFWIDANRERIRVNKSNLKISEFTLRWRVMQTVAAVEQSYWSLIRARAALTVGQQALELANSLDVATQREVAVGQVPALNGEWTASQVEVARAGVFAAERDVAVAQNALKKLIADDFAAWADVTLEPTESLASPPVLLNRGESWGLALEQRPDLGQLRQEAAKLGIQAKYHYNQLFPSLDVVGSYGSTAIGDTFENTMSDIGSSRHPFYSYGVILSVPLGNTGERNRYRAVQAARQQVELQLKEAEQDILVQVDDSVRRAETAGRRMTATRAARKYAEAAVQAGELRLSSGTSAALVVIELQQKLTAARTAEIDAQSDYRVALAQLSLQTATILDQHGLVVEVK